MVREKRFLSVLKKLGQPRRGNNYETIKKIIVRHQLQEQYKNDLIKWDNNIDNWPRDDDTMYRSHQINEDETW